MILIHNLILGQCAETICWKLFLHLIMTMTVDEGDLYFRIALALLFRKGP